MASWNAGCFLRLPEEFSLTEDSLEGLQIIDLFG